MGNETDRRRANQNSCVAHGDNRRYGDSLGHAVLFSGGSK